MRKIELEKEGGRLYFRVNGAIFEVRQEEGADYPSQVYWMVAQDLVRHGDEVILFYGPQNRDWNLYDLIWFVFREMNADLQTTVANIIAEVASSVKKVNFRVDFDPRDELDAETVKRLRVIWLESCQRHLNNYWKKKGMSVAVEKEVLIIAQLLTACQFAFNEWINIGDEVNHLEFGGVKEDPRAIRPVDYYDGESPAF